MSSHLDVVWFSLAEVLFRMVLISPLAIINTLLTVKNNAFSTWQANFICIEVKEKRKKLNTAVFSVICHLVKTSPEAQADYCQALSH